jgi:hypothetical protein
MTRIARLQRDKRCRWLTPCPCPAVASVPESEFDRGPAGCADGEDLSGRPRGVLDADYEIAVHDGQARGPYPRQPANRQAYPQPDLTGPTVHIDRSPAWSGMEGSVDLSQIDAEPTLSRRR